MFCAVNSICLWTCVSFILSLISQSGCKSTTFIFNLQNLFEKFFNLFFSEDCFISLNFWDCKGKNFYPYNPNLFSKKSQLPFWILNQAFCELAGAKVVKSKPYFLIKINLFQLHLLTFPQSIFNQSFTGVNILKFLLVLYLNPL